VPAPPPTRDDLLALARRGAAFAGDDAQATAWWERVVSAGPAGAVTSVALSVEVAVVRDGRLGVTTTTEVDDHGLRRAAEGAARLAPGGPPAPGDLPAPAAGRAHEGFDVAALSVDPASAGVALAEAAGEWGTFRSAAAKTAIVSGRGIEAYEQRSFADLRVRRHAEPGRSLELTAAAVGPAAVRPAALTAEADALLAGELSWPAAPARAGAGTPAAAGTSGTPAAAGGGAAHALAQVAPGEHAVVLGPWAVAEVLRRAALAFGGPVSPLADRLGTRVAASCVNLSDSPRFAAQLPRSYDAEGAPRQPLPLIQDGVAHRLVVPGTGHAQAVAGSGGTVPEHLVLVGGGAADLAELAAPIEHGLLVPALSLHGAWVVGRRGSALAEGVRVIRDGRAAEPAPNLTVVFEPIELLARVQALTARQRTVPPPVQLSARTASATVAPALRAAGGIHVV
jgi:predicted Zn-dependent protease